MMKLKVYIVIAKYIPSGNNMMDKVHIKQFVSFYSILDMAIVY